MFKTDPQKQREFAVEVVRQLRDHGFQAYWAGGCVRDSLLNRIPKDYDVATNANPEQIRDVFRNLKTLSIGAAFGVITVLGPRSAGQIEAATFRQDISYSDGRHPDRIAFSSPEDDARRRDFTMNGMFYDPLAEQVIDFVNGQHDLQQGIVRAIGNAHERFTEDKLRLLRAVRFAAAFGFQLEGSTLTAIREMASQVTVVSAERIADEMRRILVEPSRVRAVCLLHLTGLLAAILPVAASIAETEHWPDDVLADTKSVAQFSATSSPRTLHVLYELEKPSFPLALAALLHQASNGKLAESVGRAWKLSRTEVDRLAWLLQNQNALANARSLRWSQLQPLLVDDGAEDLLKLHAALAAAGVIKVEEVAYCRAQLARPATELNPTPFVTGADLLALGISAGPVFARLLKSVRDAQLDGVTDQATAIKFIEQQVRELGN